MHARRFYNFRATLIPLFLAVAMCGALLAPVHTSLFHAHDTESGIAVAHAQDARERAQESRNQRSDVGGSWTDWLSGFSIDNLIFFVINAIIAGVISAIGGLALLTGFLFDAAVTITIVEFGTVFREAAEVGVSEAWRAFRDIANIVMIAMFVFIAFAVILNTGKVNFRELGVRIVIIALLINFSLFFTKAIVDISNVTATQFVRGISLIESDGVDIARGFVDAAGLPEFGYEAARENLQQVSGGSGWNILIYFAIMLTLYVCLIGIFILGFVLLISRAVMLLLLMVLSPLAFAAFLVPTHGAKWWNQWWSSLIKNALFAPLLMLMLWATTMITGNLASGNLVETLIAGSNSAAGSTSGTYAPLVIILIVIGMVYASFRISSELSLTGAKLAKRWAQRGMGFAGRLSGGGLALGLGVGGSLALSRAALRGAGNMAAGVGLYGTQARLKAMAGRVPKMRDTKVGKEALKYGLLGKDYRTDAAKIMADEAKKRAGVPARQEQTRKVAEYDQAISSADAKATEAKSRRNKMIAKERELLATQEGAITAREDDLTKSITAQEQSANAKRDKLTQVRQQQQNPDLNDSERDALETQAQELLNDLDSTSANIESLRAQIRESQQDRLAAQNRFARNNQRIERGYQSVMQNVRSGKEQAQSKRNTVSSNDYVTQRSKEIALEEISEPGRVESTLRPDSMRAQAREHIGKSENQRIWEAVNEISERQDTMSSKIDNTN